MERLSMLRLSPEWESALVASLDEPPRRRRDRRLGWIAILAFLLAGLLTLLCLLPNVAFAAQPLGAWRGAIQSDDGRKVDVLVRFTAKGAEFRFLGELGCRATARFVEDNGASLHYFFDWIHGGESFCDRLQDRALWMTPTADGGLAFDHGMDLVTWHGVLHRKELKSPTH
ncbi:hypothetical protein [Luteibacter sp.]|jgi:hypothetical protein|uniref:hypothetical protein n=1 Tax=Luteibacter sp. TaxID=1886636 RepID=UPI002F3ED65D